MFLFLSCLIDLFEHLDEILRYHIAAETVLKYYLNFLPLVFVRASPLALLLAAAFIATRLSRYQELLAMNASGTSLLRASIPFLFVGWVASLVVFVVNDAVVPRTVITYEQLRRDVFRGGGGTSAIENVALMDASNRIYHARTFNPKEKELTDVTILEHDSHNHPTKSLNASRAIWTPHGWLLLYGTMTRMEPGGKVWGAPEPFVERLIDFPVTPESFSQPELKPDMMRYGQLRLLINRLKQTRRTNLRQYQVDLASKLTMPLMNLIVCLIAFAGSTQLQLRGNLRGLGTSLGLGLTYYIAVGIGEGMAKRDVLFLPAVIGVWTPHLIAVWWCLRVLRSRP